jgi:hypothetical protein
MTIWFLLVAIGITIIDRQFDASFFNSPVGANRSSFLACSPPDLTLSELGAPTHAVTD